MRPCAGTVGRAVFGLVAVVVGRDAPAGAQGGFAAYFRQRLADDASTPARLRGRVFSIRTIGP